jgi:hypothetical protein
MCQVAGHTATRVSVHKFDRMTVDLTYLVWAVALTIVQALVAHVSGQANTTTALGADHCVDCRVGRPGDDPVAAALANSSPGQQPFERSGALPA